MLYNASILLEFRRIILPEVTHLTKPYNRKMFYRFFVSADMVLSESLQTKITGSQQAEVSIDREKQKYAIHEAESFCVADCDLTSRLLLTGLRNPLSMWVHVSLVGQRQALQSTGMSMVSCRPRFRTNSSHNFAWFAPRFDVCRRYSGDPADKAIGNQKPVCRCCCGPGCRVGCSRRCFIALSTSSHFVIQKNAYA